MRVPGARNGTIADAFDGRDNALNLLRLLFAVSVVVWHAFPLGGHRAPAGLFEGRLADVGVDGFFVLSGFLVTRSWAYTPALARYAWHRFLRLMPGLWASLAVTALIFAPLAWLHERGSLDGLSGPRGPLHYLLGNATFLAREVDISGSPLGVPFPHVWQGSLWTLYWELLCYAAVVALGLAGVIRRFPALIVVIALVLWAGLIGGSRTPHFELVAGPLRLESSFIARFGALFAAGSALFLYARRIPCTAWLGVPALLLTVIGLGTDNYRGVAAPAFAYAVIWLGTAIPGRLRRVGMVHDLSYGTYLYSFPVQQLLAAFGVARWGYVPFLVASLACTAPLAAASWWVVERPALRLKHVSPPRWSR